MPSSSSTELLPIPPEPPPEAQGVFVERLLELASLHEAELANAISELKAENDRLSQDKVRLMNELTDLRGRVCAAESLPGISAKDPIMPSPDPIMPSPPGECPSLALDISTVDDKREDTGQKVAKMAWQSPKIVQPESELPSSEQPKIITEVRRHSRGEGRAVTYPSTQKSGELLPITPSAVPGELTVDRTVSKDSTSSLSSAASGADAAVAGADQVRWQWEHRTGFKNYADAGQERIERAYQNGYSKVRLQAGKVGATPMELFFADLVQYDPITKNRRRVQRVGPDPPFTKCKRLLLEFYRAWETGRPWRETVDHYQQCRDQILHTRGDESQAAIETSPKQRLSGRRTSHLARASLRKIFSERDLADNWAAGIVKSFWFLPMSMLLVLFNAIWIAIETDHNNATVLSEASPGFQIMEHTFCTLFVVELVIRFVAFQRKIEALYDHWFRFDFLLVSMVVVETWLMPLGNFVAQGKGKADIQNFNRLSILRLARLLRLSRISRLLHAVPEMAVLIKGITAASRSVAVVGALLMTLLYVFGLIFRVQAKSYPALESLYFDSVSSSMWSLFLHGTLLDNVSVPLNILKDESLGMALLFCLFVFLSNLTVMNMLIGILCDVVARVKVAETDRNERNKIRVALKTMLECYDFSNNGLLEEKEFRLLMENPDVVEILVRFGTDVGGLLTLSSIVFADNTRQSKSGALSFDEFLDLVVRLKGDHSARVTDVVEQREYTKTRLDKLEREILESRKMLREGLESIVKTLPRPVYP